MRRSRSSAHPEALAPGTLGNCAAAFAFAAASAACGAGPPRPVAPVASSCPTERPVVLASQADIHRIVRCTTLAGIMIRSGAALDTSVLRALTTITGDLAIGPTVGTQEITFGVLQVVEGAIRVTDNGLMQGLFLPRLERAGRIEIDGNVAVTTISLPRLAAVRGALRITSNASLELVDMPMLLSVDQELVLTGDPQLTLVDAAQLQRTSVVRIEVPKLPGDVADRLRATAAAP